MNGRLNASKVLAFKDSGIRDESLYNYMTPEYNLTYPKYLRGADKKVGVEIAIERFHEVIGSKVDSVWHQPVIQSIHARPEPRGYIGDVLVHRGEKRRHVAGILSYLRVSAFYMANLPSF